MEQWHNHKLHYIPKCSTHYKVVKGGLFIPQTFSTQFPEYPSPTHMQRVYSGFLVIFTSLPSTSRICLHDHTSHATSGTPPSRASILVVRPSVHPEKPRITSQSLWRSSAFARKSEGSSDLVLHSLSPYRTFGVPVSQAL